MNNVFCGKNNYKWICNEDILAGLLMSDGIYKIKNPINKIDWV